MAVINEATLKNWFSYHNPEVGDVSKFAAIRAKGFELAKVIVDNTPASADQSAAIRHVRDAIMTANASIVCGGV